jgi:uncharacterized protein (TIGR03089 family)
MTPEQLFADLLAREPSRPFVTYYDEASGERTELSVRSMGNWVAKTYHLLATELGLGTGDRAVVDLPPHWISVPVLLGTLTAGLELVSRDSSSADVAFVIPATTGEIDAAERYVVSPLNAAAGVAAPPPGTSDYVAAVRPQEDAWASVRRTATSEDPFVAGLTRGAAVAAARDRAAAHGWTAGARVLSTRDWVGPDDLIETLLAPLTVAGSVVYLRNSDDAELVARRMTQERCTDQLS